MSKTRLALVAVLLAATAAGCIVRARPCRTDCWWSNGRQICERRC
jgi:hypothetical protein